MHHACFLLVWQFLFMPLNVWHWDLSMSRFKFQLKTSYFITCVYVTVNCFNCPFIINTRKQNLQVHSSNLSKRRTIY